MVYGNNNSSVVTEDYLAGSKATHVIPSYASIDEMMYFVIESSEEDFNNMMMETGINELQHFEESGTEYIYEAEGVKGLVNKAVEFFKSMWTKVQGMIQSAISTLENKAKDFRDKVMKGIDNKFISGKIDKIKDDQNFGTSYDFADIEGISGDFQNDLSAAETKIKALYDNDIKTFASNNSKVSADDMEEKVNSIIKQYTTSFSSHGDSTSASSVSKNIKAELRGHSKDYKGSDVKKLYSNGSLMKEVTEFPSTKRKLKADYEKLKKDFNKDISDVKKAGDVKFFDASFYSKLIKGFKSLRQLSVVCEQSVISVLNERYNLYRGFLLRIIGTRVKKESAMVSESSTSDAIDSLFNW